MLLNRWIEDALTDTESFLSGVEFYELSDAPTTATGLTLLDASCRLLDAVRAAIGSHRLEPEELIPYLKFRLPSTPNPLEWSPNIWGDILGSDACIELTRDGSVFYSGVWESRHKTVEIPVDARTRYTAIFRSCKGFYDGEAWDEYENEIYVFAPLTRDAERHK